MSKEDHETLEHSFVSLQRLYTKRETRARLVGMQFACKTGAPNLYCDINFP